MERTIYLAGGCFWGVEKYLALIPGVVRTEVGYANGATENPTYEQVRYQNSGHVETVLVQYNPERLSLWFLLELFYEVIDPTSLNKQGEDVGIQYRTGIYYIDEADCAEIESSIAKLSEKISASVVVEVLQLENYWTAEEYHQKYLEKNPTGYCHIGVDKYDRLSHILSMDNR